VVAPEISGRLLQKSFSIGHQLDLEPYTGLERMLLQHATAKPVDGEYRGLIERLKRQCQLVPRPLRIDFAKYAANAFIIARTAFQHVQGFANQITYSDPKFRGRRFGVRNH
jgi:hypothetical protein